MSEPPEVRTPRTQVKSTQRPHGGESDEDEEKEIGELLRHAKEQSRRCNQEEDERRKLEADQLKEALELSRLAYEQENERQELRRLAYEQENQRHPATPPRFFYLPGTPTRGDRDWAAYANDSFGWEEDMVQGLGRSPSRGETEAYRAYWDEVRRFRERCAESRRRAGVAFMLMQNPSDGKGTTGPVPWNASNARHRPRRENGTWGSWSDDPVGARAHEPHTPRQATQPAGSHAGGHQHAGKDRRSGTTATSSSNHHSTDHWFEQRSTSSSSSAVSSCSSSAELQYHHDTRTSERRGSSDPGTISASTSSSMSSSSSSHHTNHWHEQRGTTTGARSSSSSADDRGYHHEAGTRGSTEQGSGETTPRGQHHATEPHGRDRTAPDRGRNKRRRSPDPPTRRTEETVKEQTGGTQRTKARGKATKAATKRKRPEEEESPQGAPQRPRRDPVAARHPTSSE
jgi:hypothetical protein